MAWDYDNSGRNPREGRGNYEGYNRRQKKRSGARSTIIQKGKSKNLMAITAWNYSRGRGMIVAQGFEHKKSTRVESKAGNKFISIVFEVTYRRTGNVMTIPALYNVNTGKAYLDKLGMVISTKAANGGYFGTATKR